MKHCYVLAITLRYPKNGKIKIHNPSPRVCINFSYTILHLRRHLTYVLMQINKRVTGSETEHQAAPPLPP